VAVVEAVEGYQTARLNRVRSHSPLLAAAIEEGVQRSPSFRRLVQTIDSTDGLVYVDEGSCRLKVRACLVLTVTISGPHRVLRILVEPRKALDCELIASIGHELQHAIEVLLHPVIRSDGRLYSFFDHVGKTGFGRFETEEALRAGSAVRAEVCRDKKQR
jgi:hypothetical protein